jgi:hypothetical protein
MEQNQELQDILLHGLKACEINYKVHTAKYGTTTEQEFELWLFELRDMTPHKIRQSFNLHLQNSQFFPTVADIRNAIHTHRRAKAADTWNTDTKALPAPEPQKGIPDKALKRMKQLMEEASKDPRVQKAMRRKESALKVKETYSGRESRQRNQNRREHIPMSQEDLDRIFYAK